MPQRLMPVWSVVLGVLGLGVLVVLVLLRVDARRAAATGPVWKRRLVAAALALLAAGAGAPARGQPEDVTCYRMVQIPRDATVNLADQEAWKRLCQTWAQAQQVVSGAKGEYPFDQAGRTRLLEDLAARQKDVAELESLSALTAAEAGLLKADLASLAAGVAEFRPTEQKETLCYQARTLGWIAQQRVNDLEGRLALLDKLAGEGALKAGVVYRVLGTVERQAAVVSVEALKTMDAPAREKAQQTREAALAKVKAIRAKVAGEFKTTEATPQWQTILEAWKFASPLAESGRSTQGQRTEADQKLAGARDAAVWLGAAGLLAGPEVELLLQEADRLARDLQRNPPTDMAVKCYMRAALVPAKDSLEQLARRLPLLTQLAADGKVHAAALQKVLPAVEADLKTLADSRQAAALSDADRAQAAQLQKATAAELEKIRTILQSGK